MALSFQAFIECRQFGRRCRGCGAQPYIGHHPPVVVAWVELMLDCSCIRQRRMLWQCLSVDTLTLEQITAARLVPNCASGGTPWPCEPICTSESQNRTVL